MDKEQKGEGNMSGIVIAGGQVETLRRLDSKTMDAVLGAAVRIMLDDDAQVNVPDKFGIVEALARSIAEASRKHEEEKLQKRAQDKERQKISRQRRRMSHDVTQCHTLSHDVTQCHTLSHDVTVTGCDKEREKEKRKEAKEIKKESREGNPQTPKGGIADLDADAGDRPVTDRPSTLPRGESGQEGGGACPCQGGMPADERWRRIEASARAMADAHPNPAGLDGFPNTLRRYLDKNPGATLREIVEAHGLWLAEAAAWRDGYAPKLKNWLWGGDWRHAPPKKRAGPASAGEELFECGASL